MTIIIVYSDFCMYLDRHGISRTILQSVALHFTFGLYDSILLQTKRENEGEMQRNKVTNCEVALSNRA